MAVVSHQGRGINPWQVQTPAVKRAAVAHLVLHHEVSQRRACEVLGAARSVVRYVRQRADDIT
jgi:putative transposase